MIRWKSRAEAVAWFWTGAVLGFLALFFILTSASYLKMDILLLWTLSCVAILYRSRYHVKELGEKERRWIIAGGAGAIILSFINIPIGFGNPPYSIGDLTILIAGIGIVIFGLLRMRSFILPVCLPLLAVLGFQCYELFIRHQYWITAPLIPMTVSLTTLLLSLLGIPSRTTGNNVLFLSVQGETVNLAIVPDCTGIWSLGTFTIAAALVLMSFPFVLSRKTYIFLAVGYGGTYTANVMRILFIALTGYYFGPSSITLEITHMHIGWVIFFAWMAIFWYFFFTRIVHPRQKEMRKNSTADAISSLPDPVSKEREQED
ncbi:MAG: archaeosortase/exosortase family protein [Methanomicrobiales archaeon]|nr:archaeosortase/exosortase family protein [Methanomicrobiales archaeon]